MNPPLEWILVVGAGLLTGVLAGPGWKSVLGLVALMFILLAGSAAGAWLYEIPPAAVLALEGGQIGQLVVIAYACAIAALITVIRTLLGKHHAT
jgi:hypothetical protein